MDTNKVVYNEESTAAGVLASQMEDFQGVSIEDISQPVVESDLKIALLPRGKRLQDLSSLMDARREFPRRRIGTTILLTAAAFAEHIQRFWNASTAIVFADNNPDAPVLVAIYDYHPSTAVGADAKPNWLGHRAKYQPEVSEAWEQWLENDGEYQLQGDFAEFVEDRIGDLISPKLDDPSLTKYAELVQGKFAQPSDLVTLSRGLTVNVDTKVRNAVQTTSGTINVTYDEQHKDGEGKPIDIPTLFQVCIPVFHGGAAYIVGARLRYRLRENRITWAYKLVRPDLVFADAFNGIIDDVRAKAHVDVMLGRPE